MYNYYGEGKSILLTCDGKAVLPASNKQPPQQLSDLFVVSDLSDLTDDDGNFIDWSNMPTSKIAIDPVLGRIAFPRGKQAPKDVYTNFSYGFSADIGGGGYRRSDSFVADLPLVRHVPAEADGINRSLRKRKTCLSLPFEIRLALLRKCLWTLDSIFCTE